MSSPRIGVVVASAGRAALLDEVLPIMAGQITTDLILRFLVVVPDDSSAPSAPPRGFEVVRAPRGLTAQRNVAIDHLTDTDIIVFFDDDAIPAPDYVLQIAEAFDDPRVLGATGAVLRDGAGGDEVSISDALSILSAPQRPTTAPDTGGRSLYGCNMAIRTTALAEDRFDEELPLYGWLEDRDLGERLLKRGLLADVDAARIVHLGARSGGRTAHRRFGYAQIANVVHLRRKGSLSRRDAVQLILRPLAANAIGLGSGWRRKRLLGNIMAFGDLSTGRIGPRRAEAIPQD